MLGKHFGRFFAPENNEEEAATKPSQARSNVNLGHRHFMFAPVPVSFSFDPGVEEIPENKKDKTFGV